MLITNGNACEVDPERKGANRVELNRGQGSPIIRPLYPYPILHFFLAHFPFSRNIFYNLYRSLCDLNFHHIKYFKPNPVPNQTVA